jgi:ligand-binding sensor domain-containing protein/two-component sensor histidine kinase
MAWRPILFATMALPCLIAEMLPIRSYSTADGLASDYIGKIVADSRGFIWFCTAEGLSRFDGYRFVNFGVAEGLPHRAANTLLETRAGEYLVGTPGGLCQFQAEGGGKFTVYLHGSNPYENAVSALMQDSAGRIWCGTADGLFEMLSGHRFRRQTLPAPSSGEERISVNDVVEDAGHKLWVATRSGIYVIGPNGAVQHIAIGGWTENVRTLLLDNRGEIWAGTQDGLALMRDADQVGRCGVQQVYREAGGLKHLDVTSLVAGPGGSIWAGASAGIMRWLPGSRPPVFRMLTRAQGLIDRQVNALATDLAGNVWAATEAAGVMRIQAGGFTTFREQDGLATDRVWSLISDRAGTVLAVTASERPHGLVNRFDGTKFHAMSLKGFSERPSWGKHILLRARTGAWWAATGAGLCMYAPVEAAALAGRQPETCYARDENLFQIFEDAKGRIWASMQDPGGAVVRLIRWDPATKAISFVEDGPSRNELVSAFAEDRDGNVWMGEGGGALFRYNGRQFTRFGQAEGVPAGIRDLFVDSLGRLWIASSNGLGLIEHPGSPHFGMRVYKAADGLASDATECITEDTAGRIYAATMRGVDRLDPRTGHIKHFSTVDGLARGSVRMAMRDAAGDLWFATTQGLSRLSPTADRPPAIPSVRITDLHIGRERYPVSQVGETRISRGDLQPSRNQFRVAFVGFSDEPEANLRYTYRLDGGEAGWQGPGRDHEANYPELAPGPYRFLVKAVNSEGQESATPAEIDFRILPPVWGRWWFRLSALLACGALLYGAYRYNLNRLLELERVRTRIAIDLHDDIGASLSQIAAVSEALSLRGGADDRYREPLSQIAMDSREMVSAMSDLVWAIDPRRDHLQDLVQRMRRFASDMLTACGMEFRFSAPDSSLRLSVEQRRHTFLIFKESVNNIARHSGCTEAEAGLTLEADTLVLRVHDNGRGLDTQQTGHGNGLSDMRARAKALGGAVEIAGGRDCGTTVTLRVPLGRLPRTGWQAYFHLNRW